MAQGNEEKEIEINLEEIGRFFVRNAFVFFFSIVGILILGVFFLQFAPKKYQVKATLLPPVGGSQSGFSALRSFLPGETPQEISGAQAAVALLRSRRIAVEAVKKFALDTVYHVKKFNEAVRILRKRGKVSVDDETGAINFSITDSDPKRAAQVVNFCISYLENLNEDLKISIDKPLVKILDPPNPNVPPYWPNRKFVLLILLFVGFPLGFLVAFWREYRDKRIKSSKIILSLLGDYPLLITGAGITRELPAKKSSLYRVLAGRLLSIHRSPFSLLITEASGGEGAMNLAIGLKDAFESMQNIVSFSHINIEENINPCATNEVESSHERDVNLFCAPPILSSPATLPCVAKIPNVLLVVSAQKTTKETLEESIRQLKNAGATWIGTVLVDVKKAWLSKRDRVSYID